MSTVISIGNYDGVHVGHRAIVRRARAVADERGARVLVLTFDPHPAEILRPGAEPPRILSLPERVRRLKATGADEVQILQPTRELLGQSPEAFVDRLVERHKPVAFVEGDDFRFGKGRAGDMVTLAELGRLRGFEAIVAPPVEVVLSDHAAVRVSSSLVRWLIGAGRVMDAAVCLGEPYSVTGRVVRGEQRGRTIGVPTVNLDHEQLADHALPADGVYAGLATLHDDRTFAAALSVGTKPTFGAQALVVEAHLLDFEGDLYDQTITLNFARWLRDQFRYPGLEPLKAQLARDIAQTRQLHQQRLLEATPAPGSRRAS